MNDIIKLQRKAKNTYKTISVKINEDTLKKIEKLTHESKRSRSELINILLEDAVERVEIE